MATIIAFHEVDNVDHWLHSPKRQEFFGTMGITGRLFTDPAGWVANFTGDPIAKKFPLYGSPS